MAPSREFRLWRSNEADVLYAVFNHTRGQGDASPSLVMHLALPILQLIRYPGDEPFKERQFMNKLDKTLRARSSSRDNRWAQDLPVQNQKVQELVDEFLNTSKNDGPMDSIKRRLKSLARNPISNRRLTLTHRKACRRSQNITTSEVDKNNILAPETERRTLRHYRRTRSPGSHDTEMTDNDTAVCPQSHEASEPRRSSDVPIRQAGLEVIVPRQPTEPKSRQDTFSVVPVIIDGPDRVVQTLALWEWNLIEDLRPIFHHGGNARKVVPAVADIAATFDRIDKEIDNALMWFSRAGAFAGVSYFNLSEDTFNIGRLIVSCNPPVDDESLVQAAQPLSSLFRAPVLSVLKAYVAACVYKFGIVDWEDDLLPPHNQAARQIFETLSQVNHQLYSNILLRVRLESLQHVAKPEFPSHAIRLSQRVEQILLNLRVPKAGYATLPPADRQQAMRSWEKSMSNALHLVLDLRLNLELSPMEYSFHFPMHGSPFQPDTMEPVPQDAAGQASNTVWACYRPLIQTWNQADALGTKKTVLMAKVMLD